MASFTDNLTIPRGGAEEPVETTTTTTKTGEIHKMAIMEEIPRTRLQQAEKFQKKQVQWRKVREIAMEMGSKQCLTIVPRRESFVDAKGTVQYDMPPQEEWVQDVHGSWFQISGPLPGVANRRDGAGSQTPQPCGGQGDDHGRDNDVGDETTDTNHNKEGTPLPTQEEEDNIGDKRTGAPIMVSGEVAPPHHDMPILVMSTHCINELRRRQERHLENRSRQRSQKSQMVGRHPKTGLAYHAAVC